MPKLPEAQRDVTPKSIAQNARSVSHCVPSLSNQTAGCKVVLTLGQHLGGRSWGVCYSLLTSWASAHLRCTDLGQQ